MLINPQEVYIRYKEYIIELHAKDEKQHSLPKEEVRMSMHDVGRKFLKEEIVKILSDRLCDGIDGVRWSN